MTFSKTTARKYEKSYVHSLVGFPGVTTHFSQPCVGL